MYGLSGLSTSGNSRSFNDVASELLQLYRPELTPMVAGWLEELLRLRSLSPLDAAVLRSLAASHGVDAW